MNLVTANIPLPWLWSLWLAGAGLAGLLAFRARWSMLADTRNLNVFLAATVAVLGLWLIKTGIKPGLSFHLLGATALTLMFRPLFALLAIALVSSALALWNGDWAALPGNWLLMGAVPVAVSWALYRFIDGKLPNHLFIYVFLNAFFGAALAILSVGVASTAFAALTGAYALDYLLAEYLPYYLLMAWSEAFATGMALTVMVVYKPEWVATFDDRRYLFNK
ncbi:MAG: energy-coupling factor ABC transporter permease [Pseudomonadota bacterium]